MSEYHTIRLHGPWQADFFSPEAGDLSDADALTSQQRIRLPFDQKITASEGECQIILSRYFNWPHGTQQPVYLYIDSNIEWAITLNGHAVSKLNTNQQESIANHLGSRNQLRLAAKLRPDTDIQIGEVSLKIAESNV